MESLAEVNSWTIHDNTHWNIMCACEEIVHKNLERYIRNEFYRNTRLWLSNVRTGNPILNELHEQA